MHPDPCVKMFAPTQLHSCPVKRRPFLGSGAFLDLWSGKPPNKSNLDKIWIPEIRTGQLCRPLTRCESKAGAANPQVGLGGVFWRRAPWRHERRGEAAAGRAVSACYAGWLHFCRSISLFAWFSCLAWSEKRSSMLTCQVAPKVCAWQSLKTPREKSFLAVGSCVGWARPDQFPLGLLTKLASVGKASGPHPLQS